MTDAIPPIYSPNDSIEVQNRSGNLPIFEMVRSGLRKQGLMTSSGMFNVLARHYASGSAAPFDFAVVDEAQDISIAQIRFLAAIGTNRPNALFFAGDLGQRIFQQPFSWKAAGVDLRGRSSSLKINYRTSHQIRSQADRLLDPQMADVDGNVEERKGTVSLFNGPQPGIKVCKTSHDEIKAVRDWMTTLIKAGVSPHEIALFVRSAAQLSRPKASAEQANLKFRMLDERVEILPGLVSVSTMHLAKGLEFRAVAVMACDDEIIPLQERIETVADEADLEDVYNTERQLLYVACTRARDHLLVTSTAPASEFLEDLRYRLPCQSEMRLGRGLQGRGRGSDKGPITVTRGSPECQKKPSVTRSFNRLLPASVLSRHSGGILGNRRALAGTPGH